MIDRRKLEIEAVSSLVGCTRLPACSRADAAGSVTAFAFRGAAWTGLFMNKRLNVRFYPPHVLASPAAPLGECAAPRKPASGNDLRGGVGRRARMFSTKAVDSDVHIL